MPGIFPPVYSPWRNGRRRFCWPTTTGPRFISPLHPFVYEKKNSWCKKSWKTSFEPAYFQNGAFLSQLKRSKQKPTCDNWLPNASSNFFFFPSHLLNNHTVLNRELLLPGNFVGVGAKRREKKCIVEPFRRNKGVNLFQQSLSSPLLHWLLQETFTNFYFVPFIHRGEVHIFNVFFQKKIPMKSSIDLFLTHNKKK